MKTLKDIAKEMGVSEATISYVYNDKWKKNRINPDLAKKISRKLKEEKYRPNSLGLQLKTKKTKTIGIILGDLTRNFSLNILSGIEKVLTQKGYFSIVCSSNLGILEEEQLETFSERNTDGIIFAPHNNGKRTVDIVKKLNDELPIVLVDNYIKESKIDFVVSDNYLGASLAVKNLIRKGKKKIAYIGSEKKLTALTERFDGYVRVLKEEGLGIDEKLIWKKPGIYTAIQNMLSKENPDAIFIESLMYFKEGFKFLAENNYKIPDDIALTGFDPVDLNLGEIQELNFHSLVNQPIPFVEQTGTRIGELAAEILMDRIQRKKRENSQMFLMPELKFFNLKEHNGKEL
ncbi:MAG: LacI family DNA-binding transcriptional regulator [Candidatus Omnitrophica bacterium]|nr:LacI family DNA-binding transcriptional regulator [Candidatus Omnitrophota bacterium]